MTLGRFTIPMSGGDASPFSQEAPMTHKDQWLIFDADNTLWDLEILYDRARTDFCRYVSFKASQLGSPDIPVDLVEKMQRHRDIQLFGVYGYSCLRFARSFEDTMSFLAPHAEASDLAHIRRLAMDVFDQPASPVDGLEELLERLHPHFCLAIITAGEKWIQDRRLENFHLRRFFQETLVVEQKTPEVMRTFCDAHRINHQKAWVIGDSIKSDIVPALGAGLNAIHVQAKNWSRESGEIPDGVPSVPTLSAILEHLPDSLFADGERHRE